MINRDKSIELLNRAISMEMTATHQYMYFHFRCSDYGYEPLAGLFKRIGIVEMRHIERMAERILYLGGDPVLKFDTLPESIVDVPKMLDKSVKLEVDTVVAYNKFAKECAEAGDHASKMLFEEILVEEEVHDDQFEIERDNLAKFGDKYLSLQAIEHSKQVAK